ncbi:hypothetical protein JTE90_016285 [Oedothorax gibbosus]|uniref:WKF domain-containing protein n=1 Tax=Oedothorax gibbosus TaxID=931172 RepID=A0AAV6U470_9ARAC|nr:hypothetical protein JTE90_016285 [Oedothorax gibbosus]
MKTKSQKTTKPQKATDIKSLILARSKEYIKNASKVDSSSEDDEIESGVNLRKATEQDKEKKREKRRLKKQKKKEAREKSQKKDDEVAKTEAVAYLRLWNDSRETWCFKKKLQFWLLNNAFDTDSISDEDFEILLNYIADLKGIAKTRLMEDSEKKIKAHEEKGDSISDADTAVFERARSILQILF